MIDVDDEPVRLLQSGDGVLVVLSVGKIALYTRTEARLNLSHTLKTACEVYDAVYEPITDTYATSS